MGSRLELQELLEEVAGAGIDVYFQPPESTKIKYPCIVYERDSANTIFASNLPYLVAKRYAVTVIDKNPDSDIPNRIAALPMCLFSRHFTSDNLHHDVYNIYF